MNLQATALISKLSHGTKIIPLPSLSIIIIRLRHPIKRGSFSTKSIEILYYLRSGISSGFSNPYLQDLHTVFAPQWLQLWTKHQILSAILGQ